MGDCELCGRLGLSVKNMIDVKEKCDKIKLIRKERKISMKKSTRIKTLVAAAAVACFGFAGALVAPTSVYAAPGDIKCGDGWEPRNGTCVPKEREDADLWSMINTVINVILAIVGVVAVFMIIFGGIQYSTSAGDSGKVKKAKDTILYGIIGLVIALLAFAIVNFVLDQIFSNQDGGNTPANNGISYISSEIA